MPVSINSTNPVIGYYASEENRTDLARLRSLILPGDVPDASVASGYVAGSTTVGDILDAVTDASYRVVDVATAQALAAGDNAIQPVFYRIARGSDGTRRRGDVVVQGLAFSPATEASEGDVPACFAPDGLWLNPQAGQWQPVAYDVATDTVTARNTTGTDPDALPAPLAGGVRVVTAPFLLSQPNYLAFANATAEAPVRKDYLVGYVAQQLQADEFEVFVADANKLVALAAVGSPAVTENNDYWYGRVMYDSVNYPGLLYRWECAKISEASGALVWRWFRTPVQ